MAIVTRPTPNVNTPIPVDRKFDGDYRLTSRAERLAMTVAEMVQAAENLYGMKYRRQAVHQGGVGWVEVVQPDDDPQAGPWVHLLPIGKRQQTIIGDDDGDQVTVDVPVYLVRKAAPHYGAPDWTESERMHQHSLDSQAVEWLDDYRRYVAEVGVSDPENLDTWSI